MDDYGSDFESEDSDSNSEKVPVDQEHRRHPPNVQSSAVVEDPEEQHSYNESDDSDSVEDGRREEEQEENSEEDDVGSDSPEGGRQEGGTGSGSAEDGSAQCAGERLASPLQPTRRRLQTYLLKARRAYRRGQGPPAVRHFVCALALARFVHGDRHWRTVRCQVLLARAYLDLQELPAQAEEHTSEALTTLLMYQNTELIPNGKKQVVHTQLVARLVRGQALVQLGQPAAAEELLQQANTLLQHCSHTADSDQLQLRLHTWLGRASAARGRLQPARHHLAQAERLLRQQGDHRTAVALLRELGQLELRGGRRQDAEQAVRWLQQASQLAAQCWGKDSPEQLDVEQAMLRARARLPDRDPAELASALTELQQRCLTQLGSAHHTSIRVADHLIQVHCEQEYHEKATRQCRANTKAKIAVHGELSREVADSLRTLMVCKRIVPFSRRFKLSTQTTFPAAGGLYVTSDHLERAAEVTRRCWAIDTVVFGRQDRRALATEQTLAQLERRLDGGAQSRSRTRSAVSSATDTAPRGGSLRL